MYQENIALTRKILTNPNNLVIFEVDNQKKEVKVNYAEISQLQANGKTNRRKLERCIGGILKLTPEAISILDTPKVTMSIKYFSLSKGIIWILYQNEIIQKGLQATYSKIQNYEMLVQFCIVNLNMYLKIRRNRDEAIWRVTLHRNR